MIDKNKTPEEDGRFDNPAVKTISSVVEKSDEYWEKHHTPTEISLSFTPNDGAKIHFEGCYQQALLGTAWMFAGLCRKLHIDPDAHNYALSVITKAMYDARMDEEGTGSFKEEE